MNKKTVASCWELHSFAIAERYQEGLVVNTTNSSEVGPGDGGIYSIEKFETTITDPALQNLVVNYYRTERRTHFASEDTRDVLVSTVTTEMEVIPAEEVVETFRTVEDVNEDTLAIKQLAVVESNGWRFMQLTEELHELLRGS